MMCLVALWHCIHALGIYALDRTPAYQGGSCCIHARLQEPRAAPHADEVMSQLQSAEQSHAPLALQPVGTATEPHSPDARTLGTYDKYATRQ
ncbi:hypothetical protein GCM10008955_06230 [Deinococcus malanensis]|uniref:Secreted protein n=1 Tax=Deinococcus malanensis TaxID=1706855 RepID=A0ABQ2EL75_9DEIO|nr:hypothetical protein GCM10008955_06230 [Deinococcus malanensis]